MSTQMEVAKSLKVNGARSISSLARDLNVSYEAVRLVVEKMERDGLVEPRNDYGQRGRGRPKQFWSLTVRGEHLFPKRYDGLSDALLRGLQKGTLNGQRDLLENLVSEKTRMLSEDSRGSSRESQLRAVQKIYSEDDDFITVEKDEDGLRVIEHNCPYLNVAIAHPEICAVTTNVMSNLLGSRVVRTEKFQAGAGRCVFAVLDEPAPVGFHPEP